MKTLLTANLIQNEKLSATIKKKILFKDRFCGHKFQPHYIAGNFFFNASDDTTLKGNILNKTL